MSVLPTGELYLTLDSDTFQQLGLQGTKSSDERFNVTIDMVAASFAPGRKLYDRVIDLYRASPPLQDIDKLYQKLAHFYRADCLYDLGNYEEAIKLYDAAAFRYQEDPSALAAIASDLSRIVWT